jgi:acyl-CoA synthetase (AMP-forming)/AMP-acid ligase II
MIYRAPESRVEVPDVGVTTYVLEHAERRQEDPALIDGPSGRTLTYGELALGVRSVAAGLAARGFGRGDVLGVYIPNLPEYALAFHGASAAGGLCTTVNPLYTASELAQQLDDAGARLLVTVPDALENARAAARQAGIEEVFVVGEANDATPFADLLGDPGAAPTPSLDPATDLAALPYSSGTTGRSKGVMLTHRNLVADLCQMQACFPLAAGDTLAGVLPFFHIYGMMMVLNLGLRAGATIVTMPRFELGGFLDLLERHRVTIANLVPPIALMLARDPTLDGRDLSALRALQCGGAPLAAEVAAQLIARLGCPVLEGYGLTETSSVTHVNRPGDTYRPGSIGQPVPNTECRVVDPEAAVDVAVGERGELWIRGPQVMRGYLNDPDATSATVDSQGWLRTGDVAVAEADGHFRIVDRIKELIKYNGYQVAPAELEAIVLGHPAVADVAVVGVPDEAAGELPKAFVVPVADDLDPERLIAWVGERVAPQKRIRVVETIDRIPKSPSGKILRRRLRERG